MCWNPGEKLYHNYSGSTEERKWAFTIGGYFARLSGIHITHTIVRLSTKATDTSLLVLLDQFLLSMFASHHFTPLGEKDLQLLTSEFVCNPVTWLNVHWSRLVCLHRCKCTTTPCINTRRIRKALLSICRAFNGAHRCQAEFNSLG